MFKKNKKQTETIKEPKEKKVRTVKVGTHKKTVIALWVVLVASVSFGVYKNFTAIDQHTTHEKEIIELCLQDTNGIENFVKNFAKSYYTWDNSKEAIEARTQAISGYLTKELQDLNVDTIRTDIPTSSTVTDVIVWHIAGNRAPLSPQVVQPCHTSRRFAFSQACSRQNRPARRRSRSFPPAPDRRRAALPDP